MVFKYRYLGKGETDSNGIAHMTEDAEGQSCNGYTGTGKGLTDIIASLDDNTHISDSSLQSETYAVWDCIKYDGGTISDHNDIYETLDANTKFDRYNEYSSITEVTSGTNAILKLTVPTSCTIDLELNQVDGAITDQIINIYSNNTYKTLFTMENIGTVGNWLKLRLELEEGQITITNLDDTSKTKSATFTGTANQLRLGTLSTTTEIRIRNMKVY